MCVPRVHSFCQSSDRSVTPEVSEINSMLGIWGLAAAGDVTRAIGKDLVGCTREVGSCPGLSGELAMNSEHFNES